MEDAMIKKSLLLVAVLTLAFSATATGTAFDDSAWYVSGYLGGTLLDDSKINIPGTGGGQFDVEYDFGYNIGGTVGYEFQMYRAELELAYKTASVKNAIGTAGRVNADGDVSSTALMLNGIIDFKSASSLTPYLGLGLGFASVEVNDFRVETATETVSDKSGVGAWQIIAGLSVDLSDKVLLDFIYKYFRTADATIGNADVGYGSNNFSAGVRYRF
jgi:opacity protein-like surface antigen